ncbi:MAG: bifunctional folylpolyglutamate synthase/dihydrofolate synthase [Alphaproteobacteria bacterium]|nr:bifunctional folylpolyglutamate synthase/dihydrofolate synthase [Alphaproteobacteria bacterium]
MSAGSDHILDRLKGLHPKLIDLSLDRVWRLLEALDHPQRRLPPVIHVAGTNGKGSVCAMLRAVLEAGGARVHVYTSPHLVRFHERIRLAGHLIEESKLAALLDEVEAANGGRPITFFEVTTCAAFLAFARDPADWLVLEVGLGGRLDATNVIDRPAATVITPVSLDHQHFLGETVAEIAGEKAGILKRGSIGIIGPQTPEAERVIAERASSIGAPLAWFGRDFDVQPEGNGVRVRDGGTAFDLPRPALPGVHQFANAATAIATARRLSGVALTAADLANGLRTVTWPARLQRLVGGHLARLLPPGWELWLDGGHNPAGGRVLADHARAMWSDQPLDAVIGMMNSKDVRGFLAHLAPFFRNVRCVTIRGEPNAQGAEDLDAAARSVGLTSSVSACAEEALRDLAVHPGPARVLVCGSLYFAGTVLADNGTACP